MLAKYEKCDCTNSRVYRFIHSTLLPQAGRSRLLLVHGSADTDLSFLSYNLVECVRVTTPHPLMEVRIHVHPKFTRDNFICALHDNSKCALSILAIIVLLFSSVLFICEFLLLLSLFSLSVHIDLLQKVGEESNDKNSRYN